MSTYANPDRPDDRISDAEREEAVAALLQAQGEGRLTPDEVAERAAQVREARRRSELAPIFHDLPLAGPSAFGTPSAGQALTGGVSDAPTGAVSPPSAAWQEPTASYGVAPRATGGGLTPAARSTIMRVTPLVATVAFFAFGLTGGFRWSWLFFLAVPIVGVILNMDDDKGKR